MIYDYLFVHILFYRYISCSIGTCEFYFEMLHYVGSYTMWKPLMIWSINQCDG